jgi:hypothetical protein
VQRRVCVDSTRVTRAGWRVGTRKLVENLGESFPLSPFATTPVNSPRVLFVVSPPRHQSSLSLASVCRQQRSNTMDNNSETSALGSTSTPFLLLAISSTLQLSLLLLALFLFPLLLKDRPRTSLPVVLVLTSLFTLSLAGLLGLACLGGNSDAAVASGVLGLFSVDLCESGRPLRWSTNLLLLTPVG